MKLNIPYWSLVRTPTTAMPLAWCPHHQRRGFSTARASLVVGEDTNNGHAAGLVRRRERSRTVLTTSEEAN